MTGGLGVNNVGHTHPKVVETVVALVVDPGGMMATGRRINVSTSSYEGWMRF